MQKKEGVARKVALSWDEALPVPALPGYASAAVVALCAFICFFNSLPGEFVFDDSEAILNNNDIKTSPICNLFHNDFWGTRLTHPSSHKSYRPLTVLSFRFNYIVNGLDAYSFHAVNVILHCIVSILSLKVFRALFGEPSPRASLMAAVLFSTHPVHTEAVSGIVGRADLLCALFVFIALLCYAEAVKKQSLQKVVGESSPSFPWASVFYIFLTSIATSTAMLCKEVGITALGLCSAYDVLVANESIIGRTMLSADLKERLYKDKCLGGTLRGFVWRHLSLLFTGSILLMCRWSVMGSMAPKFMQVDNPSSFLESYIFRGINYHYIYGLNLLLLLFPLWLCFDWSMGCVPVIVTFTDPRIIVVPSLWLFGFLLLRRGLTFEDQTNRYVLISLALAVVPFLPASNIFFRVGFVIAERVLYIPVASLCIFVVVGIRELNTHCFINKRWLQCGYFITVVMFVLRSQQRSRDWLSEEALFQSGLKVCPHNAKVHYNIGKVAADKGDVAEAISRYREALVLNENYDQAMNNLANILKDQGNLDEALQLLHRAVSIRPDFAAAWMNFGIVQASLGLHADAEHSYLTALSHRSVYPDCLYNLGNLYLQRGEHTSALTAWTNATQLKPTLSVAWTNMLILLDSQGKYSEVIDIATKALKHLPLDSGLHFNLANTLGKLNRYEDSERHFLQATKLDPTNANYWANLGVLYHRWRKFDQAEKIYRHTLSLNPTLKTAYDNLNLLLKITSKSLVGR